LSKLAVAADETLETQIDNSKPKGVTDGQPAPKRSLLQVDSSNLDRLALSKEASQMSADEGDTDMIKAMQQVEEVRLRMQRASERIQLEGTPAEGTLIKKKKKKAKKNVDEELAEPIVRRKKKKIKGPEKKSEN
jgi:AP-3 complex subunit delta-1